MAVGKIGRVRSPLDPAPISMIETVINYQSEYIVDEDGHRLEFRFDPDEVDWAQDAEGNLLPAGDGQPYQVQGKFARDENGRLIEDPDGVPFRQWRPPLDPQLNPGREAWPGIAKPDDIWHEIVEAAQVPGTTAAPRLQPIAARIVMLQSGMRAPMGVKVKGPDLDTIEKVALEIEGLLEGGAQRRGLGGDRRSHRRQALPGDRLQAARDRPLRADHPRRAGRRRSGHRRPDDHHDGRRPRAVPRARPLPARAAQRDRDDEEDPRPGQGRHADSARRRWPTSTTSAARRSSRAKTRS